MCRRILISGIPGTGKSTFGRWLRDERGFTYVNLEAQPQDPESLDVTGFRLGWDSLLGGDSAAILAALDQSPEVIFDWGFPVGSIFAVAALTQVGFQPWWFDGDRLVARDFFARRGTVSLHAFDCQCAGISSSWSAIAAIFGHRIVKVAQTDGTLLPAPEIAQIILAT